MMKCDYNIVLHFVKYDKWTITVDKCTNTMSLDTVNNLIMLSLCWRHSKCALILQRHMGHNYALKLIIQWHVRVQ